MVKCRERSDDKLSPGALLRLQYVLLYCDVDRLVDQSGSCKERVTLRGYDDTNRIFVMEKLLSVEKQVKSEMSSRCQTQRSAFTVTQYLKSSAILIV